MRLTLRTLLAYMDDILDPADQEDLSRQIEASDNAKEIMHRTRDATRRLRLGAPPVTGDGMELDPNFPAEYLDSVLSADDVAAYEKVCLDSDVHLAEAASCHHILTMVLGEPAEIDPEMRQKMYGVPGRVDEWRQRRLDGPHRFSTETQEAPPRKSDSGVDEPITEVPEYLKAGESSAIGRLALAFAAALVLGFGAFMLYGPGGMLRDDAQLAQSDEQAPQGDNSANLAPGDAADVPDLLVPDLSGTETDTGDELAPLDGGDAAPMDEQPDDLGAAGLPEIAGDEPEAPLAAAANDNVPALPEVTGADSTEVPVAVVEPAIDVMPAEPDGAASEESAADEMVMPDERLAMNTTDPGETMPVESADAMESGEDAVPIEVAPPEAAPLGTLVAVDQVLLRWDATGGQWLRMPARSSVLAGDQLLSLPTYRPSLALVSGLRVELSDGATMQIDFTGDADTLRLATPYGRFLLHNTDMDAIEVELAVGSETRRVVLESTAVLGMDVDRPFVAGADVEESLGTFVARFYAPNGRVTWDTAGNPITVDAAAEWTWDDAATSSMTSDVQWLNGQSLDFLLQNVSRDFERQFDTARPARIQLLELYESSRRREEKSLAAQCGTHVGQFVPFVQSLADTQQQSNWDDHIAELRRAMSRSTEAARLVHATLTEQRGAALADDLFAMLRGYGPEAIGQTRDQVQAGITRQLIDWLEHGRLEYRVLAIHNLKQIYGGKTLGYNPVVTEPSRQQRAVKLWRTRLADNELVPAYLE